MTRSSTAYPSNALTSSMRQRSWKTCTPPRSAPSTRRRCRGWCCSSRRSAGALTATPRPRPSCRPRSAPGRVARGVNPHGCVGLRSCKCRSGSSMNATRRPSASAASHMFLIAAPCRSSPCRGRPALAVAEQAAVLGEDRCRHFAEHLRRLTHGGDVGRPVAMATSVTPVTVCIRHSCAFLDDGAASS